MHAERFDEFCIKGGVNGDFGFDPRPYAVTNKSESSTIKQPSNEHAYDQNILSLRIRQLVPLCFSSVLARKKFALNKRFGSPSKLIRKVGY